MAIQREDLVAAATAGLLQYRQIDPLLIFLLQKDVRARREALQAQARTARRSWRPWLLACLAGLAAVIAAALVAVRFTMPAVESMGVGALFFFTLLYAAGAVGLATWFKRCGLGATIRVPSALLMTAAPLAVFALQQAGH